MPNNRYIIKASFWLNCIIWPWFQVHFLRRKIVRWKSSKMKPVIFNKDFVYINRYRSAIMYRCLKELPARTRYYFERHKKRWEKRYKRTYPEYEGEIGTLFGIR